MYESTAVTMCPFLIKVFMKYSDWADAITLIRCCQTGRKL